MFVMSTAGKYCTSIVGVLLITFLSFVFQSNIVYAGCAVAETFDKCANSNAACQGQISGSCNYGSITNGDIWVVYGVGASCNCTDPIFPYCVNHVRYCCDAGTKPNECGGGDSCFLAGTKITMADGTERNIEEIKEGDKVLSYDVQSQKEVINTVKEPYSVVRDSYYIIKTTSGREIRVTGEHPFYTGDRSQTHKSLIQKASAFVNIMYIYMLDGWQVVKERFR